MTCMVTTTVFATDVLEEPIVTETFEEQTQQTETIPETVPPTNEETLPPSTEPLETEAPTQAPTSAPEVETQLPQVEETEIVEPTKMAIPDVEVSDTSLMGGVIAWLCVAVGIAVVAGVLVSQRTRQVGSNPKDNRRR
ncbi:MAG: hypothetical protein IJ015_00090 [Ruminococcus sp.]|nr:hypothetical protein [Ruminococcus sp.]